MKHLFILLLFSTQFAFSQDWQLKSSIALDADKFIGVDSYKYRYWIKDEVLKKQVNGVVFSFSDKRLGRIQSVDIINPLSVFVFYQEAQTLVILDNKFNELDRIVFSETPSSTDIARIGNAGNRRIWTINAANQKLEVMDYRTKQIHAASQSFVAEEVELFSDYSYSYIKTKEALYVYNNYASLLQKVEVSDFDKAFLASKGVLLMKEEEWYFYEQKIKKPLLLPSLGIKKNTLKEVYYTREACYVFDGTSLHTYIAEN